MHIGSTLFKEFSVKNLKVNYFLSSRGVGANLLIYSFDVITGSKITVPSVKYKKKSTRRKK
jgi:hypothetical protein